MHSYLRAIGFSRIKNRKELEEVLNYVAEESEEKQFTIVNADTDMVELSKEFAERLGITVHGDRDMEGSFKTDYYFPRFVGKHISTREEITLQKHAEKDSFAGVCDDVKVGVSLIFYLNNMIEYVERHGSDEVAKFNGAVMLDVYKRQAYYLHAYLCGEFNLGFGKIFIVFKQILFCSVVPVQNKTNLKIIDSFSDES